MIAGYNMLVDLRGAYLLVLQGGMQTIHRFRPIVLAESNPYWMKQIHQSLHDVRRFARQVQYRILRLFGDRYLPPGDFYADDDDSNLEVPSYLLIPEERVAELTEVLS